MQKNGFFDKSGVGIWESAEQRPLVDHRGLADVKGAGCAPLATLCSQNAQDSGSCAQLLAMGDRNTQNNGTFLQLRADAREIDEECGLIGDTSQRARSRTLLVMAAAGALTAATVLMGWGLEIGVSEVEAGRQGRMAMVERQGAAGFRVVSFFSVIRSESARSGAEKGISDREADLGAGFDEAMKNRLDRLRTGVDKARTFVQKRAELSKILAQLRTFEGGGRTDLEGADGTGANDDLGPIVAASERRSLLARAEELRKELILISAGDSTGVGTRAIRGNEREPFEEKGREVPGRVMDRKQVFADSASLGRSVGVFVRGGAVDAEEAGEGAALPGGPMIDLVGLAEAHGRVLIERLERARVERMVEFAWVGGY